MIQDCFICLKDQRYAGTETLDICSAFLTHRWLRAKQHTSAINSIKFDKQYDCRIERDLEHGPFLRSVDGYRLFPVRATPPGAAAWLAEEDVATLLLSVAAKERKKKTTPKTLKNNKLK